MAKTRDMEHIKPTKPPRDRNPAKVDRYNEVWNPLEELRNIKKKKKNHILPVDPRKY